ncbi:MAG: tRNA uridine-5-carboxymethylaminomethyl(34) synthesis enzyme MnmG [Phycisphaeraceae bacterium]
MPVGCDYDIVVIGGGHAGAEAAWAAANMLRAEFDESDGRSGRVALVTMDPAKIGAMSCNPAIGGLAKGQIVREVDAMGGLMGLAADATGIQFRILNASKGPAVQGPRCQSDKYAYAREVQRLLKTRPNLDILAGAVEDLLVEDGRCVGILYLPKTPDSGPAEQLRCKATVLTTGTFMRGLMHTGSEQTPGGRVGEAPAVGISAALSRLGFELGRLKTGTPPRLEAESIDFDALELQPGDDVPVPFSEMTPLDRFPVMPQRPCWITHTTQQAHDLIRANLDRAPMYNGQIETAGPRYCPSIEDKVVRFADRQSHHVFLEPESLETNEIYCNGISTSLPADVQEQVVRLMPGCEKARILRYGYAVEYDMVRPHQIDATCMTKRLPGLFLAGQINGTSGYEEAAGQGLVAGVNAVCFSRGQDLLRLRRDQAYIGVMLDDLVTKIPREPYRMFTSRAEFRLLLRADNADARLTPLARELGLIDDDRWAFYCAKREAWQALEDYVQHHRVVDQPMSRWIARQEVDVNTMLAQLNGDPLPTLARDRRLIHAFLAERRYAGYIQRQQKQVEQLASQEAVPLPSDLDYTSLPGLRTEAALTLNKFRPATFGQAGRLAGVNPADLMVISVALGRECFYQSGRPGMNTNQRG